jgi:hypothetical protein
MTHYLLATGLAVTILAIAIGLGVWLAHLDVTTERRRARKLNRRQKNR